VSKAAVLSHSAHCSSWTSQHSTAAKSRLKRTAGQTRFNNLAFRAEKLPGCTFLTLTEPSEVAALHVVISAFPLAHRALRENNLSSIDMGVSDET
jgi:hypothetical protein